MIHWPENIRALLLDLDGVLIDSSSFEKDLLEDWLDQEIPDDAWDRCFPLPLDEFLPALSKEAGLGLAPSECSECEDMLSRAREEKEIPLLPGIDRVIEKARAKNFKIAVVSNNPVEHTAKILGNLSLDTDDFTVFGISDDIAPKPDPAIYREAAATLMIDPEDCLVLEDSAIGVSSASEAGLLVYGINREDIGAEVHYSDLGDAVIEIYPGEVERKEIETRSDFLSHMIEHILWRSGMGGKIIWKSDSYHALARALMQELLPEEKMAGYAITMLDGSLARSEIGGEGFALSGKDWLLSLSVEDLDSPEALLQFLRGLAEEIGLDVHLFSIDDPHHAWEAIFRSLGSAIADTYFPVKDGPLPIEVQHERDTAESNCLVRLGSSSGVSTGDASWDELLRGLGNLGLEIHFQEKGLRSSHVVAEDMGIALGAALKNAAQELMSDHGIRGYGFCDKGDRPVAISFEGRVGFFEIVEDGTLEEVRRQSFSKHLSNGIPVEDLDDFLLGFSQGMGASISVIRDTQSLEEQWRQIYDNFSVALQDVFLSCPARRGLVVGTKSSIE